MTPTELVDTYIGTMRMVHGDPLADVIQMDYHKGFFKISIPMVGDNGEFIPLPTRNLRRVHIENSIRKLMIRYQKENKYMIPLVECSASRFNPVTSQSDNRTYGEMAVITRSEGLKLVWNPKVCNSHISDPIVSVFVGDDYLSFLGMIEELNKHTKALEFGIFLGSIGDQHKIVYLVQFAPEQWKFFIESVHAGRRKS